MGEKRVERDADDQLRMMVEPGEKIEQGERIQKAACRDRYQPAMAPEARQDCARRWSWRAEGLHLACRVATRCDPIELNREGG